MKLQYPVIEAHRASREDRLYGDPRVMTAATNRHVLHPTKEHERRRKSEIKGIQKAHAKGKQRSDSSNGESSRSRSRGAVAKLLRQTSSSASSSKSDRSQLVDLVVEDQHAEDVERVRARKEGKFCNHEVSVQNTNRC